MTGYFGLTDYVLMGLYITALMALGFYLERKASGSLEDYILGGRKIPWWLMGISGLGNCFDLSGSALIISFLYLLGPRGLFIEFRGGVVLILVFLMLWTGKWHRRSGCMTGAEWNIFRFGDNWGGRGAELLSVIAAIFGTVAMLAYLIVGVGTFLSTFMPFPPMVCALILVTFATIYIMVSGFYGVVYTDLFQAVIVVIMVVYVAVTAFLKVPDHASLSALAMQITANPDWVSGAPRWQTHMPPGYEMYQYLMMFMVIYLIRNVIGGMGTGADPRYFGARNDRECGLLTCWWTFLLAFRWPMMMGAAVLGLYVVRDLFPDLSVVSQAGALIHQYYPAVAKEGWGTLISSLAFQPQQHAPELLAQLKTMLGAADFPARLQMVSFENTVNPEKVLPAVLQFGIAKGMRGLIVIALTAAALTTFGGTVNATAGMLVRNLYQRYIRPKAATRELIFASWGSVILLVVGAFAFAVSLRSINDAWGWIVMGLNTGLMVPTILRLYWWRFNGGGYVIGTIVGIVGAVLQRLLWRDWSELYVFAFALACGLAGSVAGTYLTRPTSESVLHTFYLKTRPFGMWGRFKKALSLSEQAKVTREHRMDLAAAPFALLWQVTLFLAPMLAVIHNWPAFWGALGLWVIGLAGLYWFWYRNLPAANWYE
jgi:Na+/proline symporter